MQALHRGARGERLGRVALQAAHRGGGAARCAGPRGSRQAAAAAEGGANEAEAPWGRGDAAGARPGGADNRGGAAEPSLRVPLRVVLVAPEIPQNTGSAARTCAATGCPLHLVEPLGFSVSDRRLRRAGLDYWPYVHAETHSSWTAFADFFARQAAPKRLVAFSKSGARVCSGPGAEAHLFREGDWLLFGCESEGLPPEALKAASEAMGGGGVVRMPISEEHVRSLNLAVSVGVGVYEALRQIDLQRGASAGMG